MGVTLRRHVAACTHVGVRQLLGLSGELSDPGGFQKSLEPRLGLGVHWLDGVAFGWRNLLTLCVLRP